MSSPSSRASSVASVSGFCGRSQAVTIVVVLGTSGPASSYVCDARPNSPGWGMRGNSTSISIEGVATSSDGDEQPDTVVAAAPRMRTTSASELFARFVMGCATWLNPTPSSYRPGSMMCARFVPACITQMWSELSSVGMPVDSDVA